MKILYCNRDPKLWVGGDAIQVKETMNAMKRLGHTVDFSSDTYKDPRDYDIVHIFNVNFFWTTPMVWECQKHQVPYFVSPIYFDREYDNTFGIMSKILSKAKKVFPLSNNEDLQLRKRFGLNNTKVVSNGINNKIFFKDNTRVERYLMAVGRTSDRMKGAHLIANASKVLHLPLLYVGMSNDSLFSKEVKQMCWKYYDNVSQTELADMYRKARVYVCSSLTERQSLAVLEAAACGCPIVDSMWNLGSDLLPSSKIVDPENVDHLCTAIDEQWAAARNTDNVPSWDDVAKLLESEYVK